MQARELYKHESEKIRAVVEPKAVHLLDKETGAIATYRYTEDKAKAMRGEDWEEPKEEINLLEFEKLWAEALEAPKIEVTRIISGGQTGADRGGLDAAIAFNDQCKENNLDERFELGGWCPAGRKADDGEIPDEYAFLTETKSASYSARTRKNIEEANATIVFVDSGMSGGSLLTVEHCKKKRKLHLVLSLLAYRFDQRTKERTEIELDGLTWLLRAGRVRNWLIAGKIKTLNVAGSSEKKARGVQDRVGRFMVDVLR